MDARKQVPEDVGHRNIGEEAGAAGGQGQLRREEKERKPMLNKVKEKVTKIKHTVAGGHSQAGHGHGGDQRGRDERADDDGGSSGGEEEERNAALEREAAREKGGYMEDVEDKPVATEADPEVHGAPMYESERTPAVQELVAKYDPQARAPAAREAHSADAPGMRFGDHAVRDPAAQEARHDDSQKVRLGDLGGPVVEDPAAPRSTTPAAREGEDIGTTPVVQEFESMTLSGDPAHVGAAKQGARAEEGKDPADDKMGGATYTDKLKNVVAVPAEYGTNLASTVYEKVTGGGTAEASGKHDDERTEALPVSDAGAGGEEWKHAPGGVDATADRSYGKQLASTDEAMPVSDVGAVERNEAVATDATDSAPGPGYTEKIKSAAAGTTEYGKQLASTAYEKAAGVGTAVVGKVQQATQSSTPGVGAQQQDISKEEVGSTVGQRVPAPSQVITKAREAVTSLTGGNRVSETAQLNAATGGDMKEKGNVGTEAAPVLRGEEIGEPKLNTNTTM